jgi:hypothetical protein
MGRCSSAAGSNETHYLSPFVGPRIFHNLPMFI